MRSQISSLKKQEDFKSIIKGKKINNKYLTIFFKKLSDKSNKNLNISFVVQKKISKNAIKRNRVKRQMRAIMSDAIKHININLNYSYLLISKRPLLEIEYKKIKETIFKEFESIK
tara:strand:- start:47 stop:391 length:345 start_codon:yes stop_codon:yes gene_type:complete